MTSSNIKKMVQNNFHLNPWVLSKSTNEIVNTCIQKIYKQMPQNYNNELRKPKVATNRPENKAPLRILKIQQREQQEPIEIRPQLPAYLSKKSSHSKINRNQLLDILNMSNKHNNQISRKMTSTAIVADRTRKQLLKSPNLKIYASRRYGSSASSSRSSLFRRYDERRRQRQQCEPQLKCVLRSIHGGAPDFTFAKYLMPARNQQLQSDLGSVPDAMRVSSSIQNDLMCIDAAIRNRISVHDTNGIRRKSKKPSEASKDDDDGLKTWKHPPPLSKFHNKVISQLLGNEDANGKTPPRTPKQLSHEQRRYSRHKGSAFMPVGHQSPSEELCTANRDCEKTELHEKHRRNRMKKLGLIKESPKNCTTEINPNVLLNKAEENRVASVLRKPLHKQEVQGSDECSYYKSSPLAVQVEAKRKSTGASRTKRAVSHFPMVPNRYEPQNEQSPESVASSLSHRFTGQSSNGISLVAPKMSETKEGGETSASSTANLDSLKLNGPLALAASQQYSSGTGNTQSYIGYRYNRSSYFPFRKY